MKQPHNATLGKTGEDLVAERLKTDGFTILAQNYRKRYGEVDLIANKDDLLVFVEVKTRHNPYFDTSEVITPAKQHKILTVAKEFLVRHGIEDKQCRFDVALLEQRGSQFEIVYIENAFGA